MRSPDGGMTSALRESEERLTFALDSAEAGTVEPGLRDAASSGSPRRPVAIFGFAADEVVSLDRLRERVHEDDWHLIEDAIGAAATER